MAVELLRKVDYLRDELGEFYWTVRHGGDTTAAAMRLQLAVSSVEPETANSDERVDGFLLQRWGYVQLVSLVHTAKRELERFDPSPTASLDPLDASRTRQEDQSQGATQKRS